MAMIHTHSNGATAVFLALMASILMMLALTPEPCQASPAPQTSDPMGQEDLETFLDGFFALQLAQTHTPGAVIVVVQDGELIFAKGYGLANVEEAIPMDPERTVMRLGSVSKLFVATAVMQLAEQGRLDLHADVNQYLTAFQIDATYPQPITLAHLLTHTAGLDEAWDTSTDPTAIPSLGDYLPLRLRRILPPGEAWYYSGVGYALAAYVVETVTGMPFSQYVDVHILQPLGMTRSRYLLAPPLPTGLATGYLYHEGTYEPQPVDYWGDYPSSSLTATAGDMARFMIAQLEDGCYGAACILRPETVTEMQRQQYAPHPQLDGHTYGFVEVSVNGRRQIGHSGATRGFGSLLTLLPELRLGYLVSFNQECYLTSACDILPALRQTMADRYSPAPPAAPLTPQPTTPLASLAGVYRPALYHFARAYQDTVYKLTTFDYDVTVTSGAAGLSIDGVEYTEIAPLLFQSLADGQRVAFRQNDQGSTVYLFRPTPSRKLAWHETSAFNRALFAVWGGVWLCVALVWPATLLIRRWRGRPPASRLEHVAHGLLILLGAVNVIFLVSLSRLFWASVTATYSWLTLPLISIGVTVVAAVLAGVMWRHRIGARAWRVYYSAVLVMSTCFLLFLNTWNLIGFRLG
jgi:CubicO group peptidase (beta-lactamase class C family)